MGGFGTPDFLTPYITSNNSRSFTRYQTPNTMGCLGSTNRRGNGLGRAYAAQQMRNPNATNLEKAYYAKQMRGGGGGGYMPYNGGSSLGRAHAANALRNGGGSTLDRAAAANALSGRSNPTLARAHAAQAMKSGDHLPVPWQRSKCAGD